MERGLRGWKRSVRRGKGFERRYSRMHEKKEELWGRELCEIRLSPALSEVFILYPLPFCPLVLSHSMSAVSSRKNSWD